MNKLCKLFGHKIREGEVVLSFRFIPNLEETEWQKITYSAKTMYCARCGYAPVEPSIQIGTEDANIGYTGCWQTDNLIGYMPGKRNPTIYDKSIGDQFSKFFPGKKEK